MKMVCYCCVKGCNNNSNSAKKDPSAISFHAFPSNVELRQKWLRAIGRPDWNPPSHVRICSAHFSTDKINQDGYRTRIKEDAIPVNALPPNSNFEASNIEVCRICLATEVKMLSLEKGVLKICMEAITGFNDNKSSIEGLPQFICYECAICLSKFHNLIEKSMTAQAVLLDIFAENSQITKSLVSKRDRKQLNLQSSLSSNFSMPCHYFEYVYNVEENISYLVNQYSSDDIEQSNAQKYGPVSGPSSECKLENIMKNITTEVVTPKCEVLETVSKVDNRDISSDDGDNCDNVLSDGIPNSPISYDDMICDFKGVEKKEEISSVGKNKNNLLFKTHERKLKRSKSVDGLTPDEVEMEKYFKIIKLSEDEQIKEWNLAVRQPNFSTQTVFKCEVCFKIFASKSAFASHATCHDPKRGSSECHVCKHRFKNDVLTKSHVTRAHGKKFHCKSCSKVFSNVSVAKKHHRWHTGHVYSCARCAFTSRHASALALHARTQHAHQHACARCGRAFVSARGLALHASTAHRDSQNEPNNAEFRCEECGINFTSEGARRVHVLTSKQHQKNSHPAPSPADLSLKTTCKQCGAHFPTRKDLVDHSRAEHRRPVKKTTWKLPGDSYPTQCEHCGCEVNNRKEHWWHVRKEHPTLRHHYRPVITAVCDTCGKGFQNATKLRIHELRHGSPTLRCETCSRMFHDKYALARHAAAHAPRATHACTVCNRAFALKGNLRRHERVHTGVTPYECNLCSKRFRYSSSVRLHIRTVHYKLPHPPRAPRASKDTDFGK